MMGGTIRLESKVGVGTTFNFSTRFSLCGNSEIPDENETKIVTACIPRLKILVVDDITPNRDLARMILEQAGHQVEEVGTGLDDLRLLVAHDYDAVLLGRIEGRHTPIIALMGHALESDRRRCLDAGMDGYLSKPFQAE